RYFDPRFQSGGSKYHSSLWAEEALVSGAKHQVRALVQRTLELAAPDQAQDMGRVEGNLRLSCSAGLGQFLDRVGEEEIGLAKDYERWLFVLDERLGLFYVNIHSFGIVWEKEILDVDELGIAPVSKSVITTVRRIDCEDRASWFRKGGDHYRIGDMSGEWSEACPVRSKDLARKFLSQAL